ncbi:hypothetical protein ACKKBF_B40270 [Auxenochlorella protothecoides x Auxenochlorella symbiontica]
MGDGMLVLFGPWRSQRDPP